MGKFRGEKVLVFDLGRVIVGFDPNLLIDRLLPYTNWNREDIYWFFATSDLVDKFERGLISPFDFFSTLKNIFSMKQISYDSFVAMWNDIFFPYPDMLKLVELIKEKTNIRLILLSNISLSHYEYLSSIYSQLELFDEKILSFRVGFRKPDIGIYKRLLDLASGCKAMFYTDDMERFVYTARMLEIDAEVFRGIDSLRFAFERRNHFAEVADLISNERLSEVN